MKHCYILLLGGYLLATLPSLQAEDASSDTNSFGTEIRPLLDQYCIKCHGKDKRKGGVDLAPFTNSVSIYHDIKLWENVAAKLKDREMPPEDKPQPSNQQRAELIQWIESSIRNLDEGKIAKDPGRVLIHRLSKTEYNCTIRDLFGVDSKPADKFPTEGGGGGGFDNDADTLFVPPILMERYLQAATEVLDQAAQQRIFFVKKPWYGSERDSARKIIEHFARLGFRRPVQFEEVDRLLLVYKQAKESGMTYESSVKTALKGILVSPKFLFRIEEEQAAAEPYRISDYELASRLSYFLWSSMPDEELFQLAGKKQLNEPAVLEAQVRRMVRDSKARVFADDFAGQWLRVRELKATAQPDEEKFPEFTASLREAMYQETIQFFDSIIQEDRSLLQLLDADYTYVNEELAKLYAINGVKGKEMQRVELKDKNRGGVLGMGAVLTLTSYPKRTSPVLRGKWVLEEILGTPPPPPPPLVKSLPQNDKTVDGLTMRQQLEKHRSVAECAGCHSRMDPLGFGLENFDAIGRWRTTTRDDKVDASGVMPTGEKFEGPAELKKVLLNRKADFSRNLTEKMLAYALGRGLEYYDVPTVKQISKKLAENEYRSSVLISEIVKSYPFQYRRPEAKQQASN